MDNVLWNVKWMFTLFLLFKEITYNVAIDVYENSEVTIQCPLSGDIQYPTWTGPEGLADPLTDGQTINEPKLEWVNNKDLKIASAQLKHDGTYTCKDANNNTGTVELDVQYFSASVSVSTATPDNTRIVLTCTAHSNPASKIVPHIFTHIRAGDDPADKGYANITFNPCGPDPSYDNKTKCSVTAVLHVSKEDNGQEMNCAFQYENITQSLLHPKVRFLFPPTMVNITGNRQITDSDKNKLKLKCSTDSSNPVSTLVWRRGTNPVANLNTVISSNHQSHVMDAEYNGKNITQDIDVEVDKSMDNEKVFCCASHQNKEYCDSITLDYLVASAGYAVANWVVTLYLVCAVFFII